MHFIFSNVRVFVREISEVLPEDIGYIVTVSSNLYFVYIHMLRLVHPHRST